MRISAILAITAIFCAPASAHHSYAAYDRCKRFTIAGEIERISWANPHVVFTLKVDDTRSYLVQWVSVERLHRAGMEANALNVGDRVVVSGSRHRDPDVHIVSLVTAMHRPSDGWEWSEPAAPQDNCEG